MIYDNVIIAHDIIYTSKRKKWGKNGSMALKLNMSKAYDLVEWVFLEAFIRRLRFLDGFISLVMSWITSISYLIVVNGFESGNFVPLRGLRQG